MNRLSGRVTLFVLAGLAAGLLTWFFVDVFGFLHISDNPGSLTPAQARDQAIAGILFGAFVALALGVADTLASGVQGRWAQVVGFGLVVGAAAGAIGLQFGMAVYGPLYVKTTSNSLQFLWNVLARALGWAFIGAFAGTSDGFRKWSVRVGRNGFIGGLIGGLAGGTVFEIIPNLLPGIQPGPFSRLFGFVITAGMIGLFVSLVQSLFKEAWVRVVVGRNEGREYLVEKAETKIGRAELSDIPLFGDPQIARNHAVLAAAPSGGGFVVRDTGESPLGVLVNGAKIAGVQPVRSGDQIQVGGRVLVFHERLTRTRTAPAARDVAAPRPAVPSPLPSLADALPPVAGVGAPNRPLSPPVGLGGGATRGATVAAPPLGATGAATRLVATSGPHTGAAFPLQAGAVIGRDAGVAVALPADSKASRAHARLVADGASGSVAIEDAGSTNGTFVNGQRVVGRVPLVAGDTVMVGTTSLRVE